MTLTADSTGQRPLQRCERSLVPQCTRAPPVKPSFPQTATPEENQEDRQHTPSLPDAGHLWSYHSTRRPPDLLARNTTAAQSIMQASRTNRVHLDHNLIHRVDLPVNGMENRPSRDKETHHCFPELTERNTTRSPDIHHGVLQN